MLAHSVGCLPISARDALEADFFQPWARRGGDAWEHWLEAIEAFRSALAALLGGTSDQWCPQPTISTALSRLLSGVPFAKARTKILMSHEAFPSIGFAAGGLERLGLQLELLEGDPSKLESWARIADGDVAAVVAMHVHSNSGAVSPIADIAALAKAHGVFSVMDIAQSAGILPIAVDRWGVDAVVGTSVKWLCGGPGGCFLWVDPSRVGEIEPLDRGWFSHDNPFEMDIGDFRYAADARRFWGGTPSVAPYVLATAGIETIARFGVERVRAHNRRLADALGRSLGGALARECDLAGRGGTICLTLDARRDRMLKDAGCFFDRRGARIRLSFGPWNDEADLAVLTEALSQ